MNEKVIINLTPDPKVLIALTHTHIQPLDALCELIDNAIDSFSSAKLQGFKIENPTVRIDLPKLSEIEANKGLVRISDNGPGLTVEAAEKALRAGFSGNNPYDTLGLFGMGFNISTGKLGSVTRFFSVREDGDSAVEVTVDLNEINETKNYQVAAYKVDKGAMAHGTIIEVSNWWPNGNANRGFVKTLISYGVKKIRDELGRRYATILRKDEIKIIVNDVQCDAFEHCVWDDSILVDGKHLELINTVNSFQKRDMILPKRSSDYVLELEDFLTANGSIGKRKPTAVTTGKKISYIRDEPKLWNKLGFVELKSKASYFFPSEGYRFDWARITDVLVNGK